MKKIKTTFNENGTVLTESIDGVEMPAKLSFECVNDFVYSVNRQYEELQYLCLGLADEIEKHKTMLKVFKICIETGVYPEKDSTCYKHINEILNT